MNLSLHELYLSRGSGGVHCGWRVVAGLSKENKVWSHFWKEYVWDQQEMNKEGAAWQGMLSAGYPYQGVVDASPCLSLSPAM